MAISVAWTPQEGPQLKAIQHAYVEELFFGGAVGGGKTDYLLGDFAMDVPEQGESWKGILFRTSYPQIEAAIQRSLEIYPKWFPGVVWKAGTKTWEWPNGSFLRMRFLADENSWLEYQGHDYSWIGYDELPQWGSNNNYKKMKARLRGPAKFKRIRGTGNPGGAGHAWIKEHWRINDYPDGGQIIRVCADRRMFIKSRISDNKILLLSDPNYITRLDGLGSPQLVQAWKDGDWNVTLGAFFPEFNEHTHVIKPIVIPSTWAVGRAMDWGSAKPYCVLWFAIVGEDTYVNSRYGERLKMPRGALCVYRELYGCKINPDGTYEPDTGTYETASAVGRRIVGIESGERVEIAVLDPACFNVISGPSIAEQLGNGGAHFGPADNTRIAKRGAMSGWNMVRERLTGETDEYGKPFGEPMLFFFETCMHTRRTLPIVQADMNHPEDITPNVEDHAVDTVRYMCNSRPFISRRSRAATGERIGAFQYETNVQTRQPTFNELVAARRRARLNK